jgi:hypothetical protein
VNSQEPVNIELHHISSPNLKPFVCNGRKVCTALAFILRRLHRAKDQTGEGEMIAVTKWAEERQAARISLGVAESNLEVQKFYERLGYVDSGMRVPLASNPTLQVVVMVRRLTS